MARVAVVGGTSGLGRTIAEQIANGGKHTVFVFTREKTNVFVHQPKVRIKVIDYSSADFIAQVLRENNIDTLISTTGVYTEGHLQVQLNLVDGAVKSGTVRRFVPSEFGADNVKAAKDVHKARVIGKLETTTLEYTRFINGCFMDYFGYPLAPTYLQMLAVAIDVENCSAAIPGDGNARVAFTYSADIGIFVAAALDLPRWPKESFMAGDVITLNEVLEIAKTIRGQRFKVAHDSLFQLKAGNNTELPANVLRYPSFPKDAIDHILCGFGTNMAEGWLDFPELNLNKLLPEIRPFTIRTFLETFWAGK